jgi:hypothetical protein
MNETREKGETIMRRFEIGQEVYVIMETLTEKMIGCLNVRIGKPGTVVDTWQGGDRVDVIWEGDQWPTNFDEGQLQTQRERMHVA